MIREAALTQSDAEQELRDIAAAIGSVRFMDPPDGGDVSLAEQVTRMRKALEKAEAALEQSDAEPVAWRSTPAMRTRIRELARPDSDDYDRAVIAVLDDFENMPALAQSDAQLPCGHPKSLEIVSVESDYRACELCEARAMKRDAEFMEARYRKQIDDFRDQLRKVRTLAQQCAADRSKP